MSLPTGYRLPPLRRQAEVPETEVFCSLCGLPAENCVDIIVQDKGALCVECCELASMEFTRPRHKNGPRRIYRKSDSVRNG